MPNQRKINIRPTMGGPPNAGFDPDELAAKTRDQIFWTNRDKVAHWPGLLNADGTINKTFFMPNQLAPQGDTSPIFSPTNPRMFKYACSLHPDEQGVINVT